MDSCQRLAARAGQWFPQLLEFYFLSNSCAISPTRAIYMKHLDFICYLPTGLQRGIGRPGTFYTAPLWKSGVLGRFGFHPPAGGVSWPMSLPDWRVGRRVRGRLMA